MGKSDVDLNYEARTLDLIGAWMAQWEALLVKHAQGENIRLVSDRPTYWVATSEADNPPDKSNVLDEPALINAHPWAAPIVLAAAVDDPVSIRVEVGLTRILISKD